MQYEPFGAYIYGMGVEEDQIERACASRGWIFWDADSFERENLICYVADCSDRGYGRKDFLELAGEMRSWPGRYFSGAWARRPRNV